MDYCLHLYCYFHNGIRTGDPRGFNEGRSSKFREGSRVRQTFEEGRRTYRQKRCGNNNKDEDNSPKAINICLHSLKWFQILLPKIEALFAHSEIVQVLPS